MESFSSSAEVIGRTVSWGENLSMTLWKCTLTRAGTAIVSNSFLQIKIFRTHTLQQTRYALRCVLDYDFAPAIQQEAVEGHRLVVLGDRAPGLDGAAAPALVDFDSISRGVFQQEPKDSSVSRVRWSRGGEALPSTSRGEGGVVALDYVGSIEPIETHCDEGVADCRCFLPERGSEDSKALGPLVVRKWSAARGCNNIEDGGRSEVHG